MAAFVQVKCRFSDAGNDDLATRSGDRRPKSAKARNRGRYARSAVPLAQLWGFERRACRVSAKARTKHQSVTGKLPTDETPQRKAARDHVRAVRLFGFR